MTTTPNHITGNLAKGTWTVHTTEGTDLVAADLRPGMQVWDSGLGFWNEVLSVSTIDRHGKVTVKFAIGGGCRMKADLIRRVK